MVRRRVRPGFFNEEEIETQRAFRRMTDQFNRALDRRPMTVTVRVGAVSATGSFTLIPEAPTYGVKLGRLRLIVDTTHAADSTDYWSFELCYYGTYAGVREKRDIANGTLDTTLISLPAFVPVTIEVDHTLLAGETLVLVATKAASAANLSGLTVQAEEAYAGG